MTTRTTSPSPRPKIITLPSRVFDSGHAVDRPEDGLFDLCICGENHSRFSPERGDKSPRCIESDDFPAVDDGDAVAELLRFFHVVGREKDRFPPIANMFDQFPHRPAGLRIEAGRELVQKNDLGIVDESESDKQALLLSPREFAEGSIQFLSQAELIQERLPIRRPPVKGGKKVGNLPDSEPVRERAFLQLDTDPFPQFVRLMPRVQPEDGDSPRIRTAKSFQALDGRCLAGPVWADHPKNLARTDIEGHSVDGDDSAVNFAQAFYGYSRHAFFCPVFCGSLSANFEIVKRDAFPKWPKDASCAPKDLENTRFGFNENSLAGESRYSPTQTEIPKT